MVSISSKPPTLHNDLTRFHLCHHRPRSAMTDTGLPPPYSLTEEREPDPIPQQRPHLTPTTSSPSLRSSFCRNSNIPPLPTPPNPVHANERSPGALPPSYFDVTTFSIGTKSLTRPLVTLEQVKLHLRLLRAFKLFQQKVEDPYSDPVVADVVPPIGRSIGAKGRWLWFLEMAVERYACFFVPNSWLCVHSY